MALSSKCIFLVFLCLTVLLTYIAEFAKAQGKGKPIVIATCYQFPHCNIQTCVVGFLWWKMRPFTTGSH
ncbi:unnamed protein product [Brassica oleracea]